MKKLPKKYKIFLFLGVGFLTLLLGTSLAYYYQEVVIPNEFKTMTYDVELEEEFNNDWGVKKVYIVNNDEDNAPVVLRVNYNEMWSKEIDGIRHTLNNYLNGENVVTKNFTSTFLNDFTLGDDGWYYYKKVLNPNSRIQLLESIALKESLIASNLEYKEYNYQLDFNYEAIQATANAVSDIWNKNITINGSNVVWG